MSIINFESNKKVDILNIPSGSYSLLSDPDYYRWETHKGNCVCKVEHNYYDYSSFCMVIYFPESDTFEEIGYDNTNYAPSPSSCSYEDASDELKEKYWNHIKKEKHRKEVLKRWENRQKMVRWAKALNTTRKRVNELKDSLPNLEYFYGILKLFTTKLRSPYRKSLREQVQKWINGESEYKCPLSYKQLSTLTFNPYKDKF